MKKLTFLILQVFLFLSLPFLGFSSEHNSKLILSDADCLLSNLKIEKSACTAEKTFFVTINFTYQGNSECFKVTGGGNNYGQFKYSQLPIKIGPLKGDCTTEYEFVIRDCVNEKCSVFNVLGKVCCEAPTCMLSELNIIKSDCDANGNFYATLKFAYKNVGDCFTVQGNGVNYGKFKYSQLPLKIGPLKGNCETEYEFQVSDCNNERCTIAKVLGKVCCEQQSECKIYDAEISKTECNKENEYFVKITFKFKNTSDSFDIVDSTTGKKYGRYAFAKLPILIGPFKGDCKTNSVLKIFDSKNEKCSLRKEIGIVCCEQNNDCKLSEFKLEKTPCNENKEFYVYINFNHLNTSDCFTVTGNSQNYGTYKYANLPIKIGPLKGDCKTEYEFVIRDCHNEKCALEGVLGKVCCETQGDCKLSEFKLEKTPCNENKEFYVYINFNHLNTSDCFTVTGNGQNYGTYNYANLPIKIGPLKGDCKTEYEFIIRDCHNEKCALEGVLGKVCCETQGGDCKLSELKMEKTPCNENKEFYVYLNFNHLNTSDCFTVSGNGQNYGTFNYANLPIKIGPLKGDCKTEYEFVIRDCHNEKCVVEGVLGKVCCETQGGDCLISDLTVTRMDCKDGLFYVKLDFKYKNISECFVVKQNDNIIGKFKYGSLPILLGPFKGDCKTEYYFTVSDCLNERCAAKAFLGKVCCETQGGDCKLSDLKIEKTPCNENKEFYVYLNFNHLNTSDCFTVSGNGQNYGTFNYANLPIKIGPLKGDCKTEYEFVIRDCHNEKCVLEGVLGKVCCETQGGDCLISDLTITKTECKDGLFFVKLSFNYKNVSECFVVKQNDNIIGKFKYGSLPILFGPFKGDCKTEYYFTVSDCLNERCAAKAFLGKVCCETQGGDCKLSELKMEKTPCNENKEFYVYLNFNHLNTSDCFTVSGNGHNYGTFNYANLPIKIGPLKGDCKTEYEFVIRDCHNEKCVLEGVLGKVCCETQGGDCLISDLTITKTECKDGLFFVKLSFNYKNVSECFVVKQNDNIIGKFKYGSLPILLGPFKGDCKTEYYFTVSDCLNERCAAKAFLGKVCCETQGGDCKLSDLKIEKTPCNENKEFYVYLNFNHLNTSDCFTISGNGQNYGTFNYANLPIKIGPLKGDCKTEYEFVIRDCHNERCVVEGVLGKVCCETQELCELSNLEIARGDCNSEGMFFVKLSFKYKNVAECFIVKQNNNIIGRFKYAALPIQLGPFRGDCITKFAFTVTDCENERCSIRKEIGRVCCVRTNECMLNDLKFEKTSCDANRLFYLSLKFAYKNNSECFTVSGNGVNYGTFKYSQLPLKIGPLKGNCETKYEFTIRDCKNERCALVLPLGIVCCEKLEAEGTITDLQVKTLDCTGIGQYAISLNFNSKGTKGVGFDVFDLSGNPIGFYSYASLPLTIKDFKSSGKEVDYLKVCENDNEKCCAETKFIALRCFTNGPKVFHIGNIELRYSDDQIAIHSDTPFPSSFSYHVSNLNGQNLSLRENGRSSNDIIINTNNLIQGIFILTLQNSNDLRNLKFIK